MSKRNWIKYAALIGIISVSALLWVATKYRNYQLENNSVREKAAKHDTGKHQTDLSFNCVLIGKAEARCSVTAPDTESASEHTKADLKAQQDVAEWTVLSTVFSGVGVILSVFAVAFTGWAAWAAASAARAAESAVDLARQISADESRAYLNAVTAELHWTDNAASDPYVMLGVKNSGHTPAKWLEIHTKTFVTPPFLDEETRKVKFSSVDMTAPTIRRAAGMAGDGYKLHFACTDDKDRHALRHAFNNNVIINIAGIIIYETIFGEIIKTEFWFQGENVTFRQTAPPPPNPGGSARYLSLEEVPHNLSMALSDVQVYKILQKKSDSEAH